MITGKAGQDLRTKTKHPVAISTVKQNGARIQQIQRSEPCFGVHFLPWILLIPDKSAEKLSKTFDKIHEV